VTQSNAASAEESAAAAQELNVQAEVMKAAVIGLLCLVDGAAATGQKTPNKVAAVAKPAPVVTNGVSKSNGHVAEVVCQTDGTAKHHRSEIPLEGDFKNF
jgi:transcription initiation factor TFIIIB Brf1 subunit/transcription initiation factor TFIIB